jgi:hypothetical protein
MTWLALLAAGILGFALGQWPAALNAIRNRQKSREALRKALCSGDVGPSEFSYWWERDH